MDIIKAVLLGVVEGITEFLPVSSTGHLILAGAALDFEGPRAKAFEIFIQLGAILAIVWLYRSSLLATIRQTEDRAAARRLMANLAVAFLPAALIGLAAHRWIKEYLFAPTTVGIALILGGLMILVVERWHRTSIVQTVDQLPPRIALGIGCIQVLSLIPGISRSGATIMGGLVLGLSRPAATEFSFFLAIPVMFAATLFDLVSSRDVLGAADAPVFAIGFLAAFVSAVIVVRLFLRFVAKHTFRVFAWYRIAIGVVVLVVYFR